jgi:hypothetical protein
MKFMPRPGTKVINVSERAHNKAKEEAAKRGLRLKDFVEGLIDQIQEVLEPKSRSHTLYSKT